MRVEIKKAGLTDIDLLVEWRMTVLHEVFSIPPEEPMEELKQENRQYYQEALLQGAHIACFAYAEGQVAGCGGVCLYREMPSPDNPTGYCAYLMNIYTRADYRGNGVGKKMVNWLVQQAVSRGITKIYLETSSAGRTLYSEMGFAPMPDQMKLLPDAFHYFIEQAAEKNENGSGT